MNSEFSTTSHTRQRSIDSSAALWASVILSLVDQRRPGMRQPIKRHITETRAVYESEYALMCPVLEANMAVANFLLAEQTLRIGMVVDLCALHTQIPSRRHQQYGIG